MIAGFMRWGAVAAVAVALAGLVMMIAGGGLPTVDRLEHLGSCREGCGALPGAAIALTGLALLVAVSVGRLLLCSVLFLHEGDPHFAVISVVTVLLVAAAALFRLWG